MVPLALKEGPFKLAYSDLMKRRGTALWIPARPREGSPSGGLAAS